MKTRYFRSRPMLIRQSLRTTPANHLAAFGKEEKGIVNAHPCTPISAGGIVSLFTGMSLMTLIEFLFWLLSLCCGHWVGAIAARIGPERVERPASALSP